MILELVPHGELYNYINDKTKPLDWDLRLRIAWDVARGLAFLHASDPPLLHRDMKSPNVLLSATTADAYVCAKVADFGLTGRVFTDFKAVKASERDVENPTWLAPVREPQFIL
jgi:serine/threonine protein kinase